MIEGRVGVHPIPKDWIYRLWPHFYAGVCVYREKTPHQIGTPAEILLNWCSEEGDDVVGFSLDGKYAGFASYRMLSAEGETWATFAMIYATEDGVLEQAMRLAKRFFRERGADRINYFTARKGFRRLAPRLGFEPRIIEYTMEVN